MATVVVDTNVVVAGLLTHHKDAAVARVLDGMLGAAFAYEMPMDLLAEYREVLMRADLRKLHGLSADEIDALLAVLVERASVLSPPRTGAAAATAAAHPWRWLASRDDLRLVTGDRRLLESELGARMLDPDEFVASAMGLAALR
ncbi:PIN domain-containing protein [Dokdonella sp.]|uniref:PIN domain-containing protein n=1 Tax=Dokdonella sp. TaxID=2291710 RepID=UPI0027B8816F|nr:PIN domain-containing protein [Dokdonella sp.]